MDRNLWGLDVNNKDHLVFGGCDVVDIAKHYGTPLYIVDSGKLRANYRGFLNAFKNHYDKVKVFYSYKTNPVPGVLRVLHQEGCGAEITSPYELWLAFRLGVEPSEIIYNGVNKAKEDLRTAVQKGVGFIIANSVGEILKLNEASGELEKEVNMGIRIYPEAGWKAQFGLEDKADKITDIFQQLGRKSFLQLCCLHIHIGTGIKNTEDYKRAIETICRWMKDVKEKLDIEIKYVNLGGGFGVPTVKSLTFREIALYKIFNLVPKEPLVTDCPPLEVFGEAIADSLTKSSARYGLNQPGLLLEPGRVVTSNTQVLLLTVGEIRKRKFGTKFAITDGGLINTAYPLSYEHHACFLANRASAEFKDRYSVTGPTSTPADVLYRNWKLPALEEGDVLAIMDAGAYFTSFANNFSYPRPGVVLLSNGCHEIVRQHESFEHITAMDKI